MCEFSFPGKELTACIPIILFPAYHKGIQLASTYEHTLKRLIHELEEMEQRTSCFLLINSECLRFTTEIPRLSRNYQ